RMRMASPWASRAPPLPPLGTWGPGSPLRRSATPCKSNPAASAIIVGAVADARPQPPVDTKPVGEQGSTSAVPSNPNSRLRRCKRSPFRQGWDKMDAHFVGIDVSQDWLDVHVVPTGESFRSKNTSDGIDELAARLRDLAPERVAPEATGGLERLAAAQLSAAGLPVVIV